MIWVLVSLTFMAISTVSILGACWFQYCSFRTHAEVLRIIEALRQMPVSYPQLAAALHAVDYDKHLGARLWGCDPFDLYDPVIRDLLEHPRCEIITGAEFVPFEDGEPSRMN